MKQNQTYFIEKHRIFPWYLPTAIFEQCTFWSRCCGIYDSYSWDTYLPKIFWILPGMFPTRFVGNNLWEIPPKTGYGNMFQNISIKLFVDMSNKYDCYSSYSWKKYEVTSGVCPGDLFLRKSVWQISHWKLLWWYLPRKNYHEDILPKGNLFGGKSPKTPHLFWRYFVRGTLPNNLWRATVYQTNFEWRYLPNKFQRKPLPKIIWKSLPTKKKQREISTKKISREISPPKKSNNLSTNNYVKKFYQGNSEETFPAKLKIWNKNLSKHLSQETFPYQANWRNVATKRASEEKSLPKRMKKHLHQKIWEKKHNK